MMKNPSTAIPSPLLGLKNARELSAEEVKALEKKMTQTYVARMAGQMREARLRADRMRDKTLY